MPVSESLKEQLFALLEECAEELHRLDRKIGELQKQRDELVDQYKHARALLNDRAAKELQPEVKKSTSDHPNKAGLFGDPDGQIPKNMPFRDILRHILHSEARPMRPAEIANLLNSIGYDYDLKTDLTTRIGNELYRMKKSGELVKTKDGYIFKELS